MKRFEENAAKNTHNVVEALLMHGATKYRACEMRVLDLPCGEGAFTRRILNHGANVVSGDIVNLLKVSEKHNFTNVNMDRTFPFAPGEFTDIICIDGIEHIERQFDFVRECNRVLKLGGRMLISTPNISSARSRMRYFLTGHHNKCKSPLNESNITSLHHKGMISFPELRYLLHTNGFEIETITTNRIKSISYLYLLFYPLLAWFTLRVYRREEKNAVQQSRNRDIRRMMLNRSVYLGETLIVSARKKSELSAVTAAAA
jgi:2-polyprenyl-3-methyl-5-hydroxy-6-metoxy-1,4-benzoquinol methylase